MSTDFKLESIFKLIESLSVVISAPASLSLSKTLSIVSGLESLIVILPPVIATAVRYVAVSILSGMILKLVGLSSCTPSISNSLVPAPLILAPIWQRHSIKSLTSGSLAAFLMMVLPSAKTAAIKTFSVPVTLIVSKRISAPFKPFTAFAFIYPPSVTTSAPNFFIDSR